MGGSQFRESPIFFFSSPFSSIFSLKPWKLRGKVVSLHKNGQFEDELVIKDVTFAKRRMHTIHSLSTSLP